jgi:tRNA threonylcarbamoyladenosine biosynthesis protein TsaE
MASFTLRVTDETRMQALGAQLAEHCPPPAVIFFRGPLGAGKTTLIRGFLRALGVTGPIKSPSFAVVESYPLRDGVCHHFDFYRLKSPEELEFLGFRDYLEPNTLVLIEWPEQGGDLVPVADIEIDINFEPEGQGRVVTFSAKHESVLTKLQ